MLWDLSCRDWEQRLLEGKSLMPSLPLDRNEANRAIKIFNKLKLPDVAGHPPLLTAAGDWWREIVGAVFGSMVFNQRMVREVFCMVPKKSSKTTNGAGTLVTAMVVNERPRAEYLFVGPTHEVSDLAFSQAAGMIAADDYLASRFHVRDHLKQIDDRLTAARLKIKTFDTKVMTGVKPVGVMVDEIHEIASLHDADRVIGQIRGGLISQPEGFLIFVTTQSERPPQGVFEAELKKARAIRDGKISGAMLPIIYEFPPSLIADDKWRDTRYWSLVNPNAGRTIQIQRLKEEFDAASVAGEGELRRWASQHLNIEIGVALLSDAWAGAALWSDRADPSIALESLLSDSDVICVGIDGGGLDDLLGFAAVGRHAETRQWRAWCHAWCFPEVLERRKSEAARLEGFAERGQLTICDTPGSDVEEICDLVEQIDDAHLLPDKNAIGVDPIGIGQIVDALAERGIDSGKIAGIPQGYRLNGAIKTLERKLADGTFAHDGSELMNWCVGNAKVEQRGNSILITKQASGTAKIDPLMALFDASALMTLNPTAKYASVKAFASEPMISWPQDYQSRA